MTAFMRDAAADRLVDHQIRSYNDFIENRIQRILNGVGQVEPELPGGEDLVIKLGDVEIEEPVVKEADGSITRLLPSEARRRDITYAARIKVTMTPIFEGRTQEPEEVIIGRIPVMVGSDLCPTSEMDEEELVEHDEDPDDPGGYFIINGTEKTLVTMEEMANNKPIYQHDDEQQVCRINSENDGYVQRHQLKRDQGVVRINFANVKKVPAVVIMRALGMETDKQIVEAIGEEYEGEIFLNIYDTEVETAEEAVDYIGRKAGINNDREERVNEIIDQYLLPHIGQDDTVRQEKAVYLGKLVRNTIALGEGDIMEDDMDHYENKRLLLAGDLLEMQFRSVFLGKWGFVARMKYNFQKSAKRGRIPSLQSTVVSDTLSKQIMSAMATGNWVGNRTGVSQRLERMNRVKTLSHLRNVVSPLSAERQHFEARELHATHWGRLGPIKTPEGMNIGLRKYLALSADVTAGLGDEAREALTEKLRDMGVAQGDA